MNRKEIVKTVLENGTIDSIRENVLKLGEEEETQGHKFDDLVGLEVSGVRYVGRIGDKETYDLTFVDRMTGKEAGRFRIRDGNWFYRN